METTATDTREKAMPDPLGNPAATDLLMAATFRMLNGSEAREKALHDATEVLTSDHSLVECLTAWHAGKDRFQREAFSDSIHCDEYMGKLADQAWDAAIDCKAAGLTALAELCERFDQTLRKCCAWETGRKYVPEALRILNGMTADADRELEAAS